MTILMLLLCCFAAASLCEAMKRRRETPVVQDIGDIMLARVRGEMTGRMEAFLPSVKAGILPLLLLGMLTLTLVLV